MRGGCVAPSGARPSPPCVVAPRGVRASAGWASGLVLFGLVPSCPWVPVRLSFLSRLLAESRGTERCPRRSVCFWCRHWVYLGALWCHLSDALVVMSGVTFLRLAEPRGTERCPRRSVLFMMSTLSELGMVQVRSLGLSCNGDHPHLPWQQGTSFATKHEAEYTEMLCMKVAGLLADVQGRNCSVEQAVSPLAAAAADSAHKGMVPRGSRLVSMIEGGSGIGCASWRAVVSGGLLGTSAEGGAPFLAQAQKAEHPFSKQELLPDRVLTSVLTWGAE